MMVAQPTTNSYESGQPDLLQEHRVIAWANDQNSGTQTADTEMKLATGGNIGSTRQNLWKISGSAKGILSAVEQRSERAGGFQFE